MPYVGALDEQADVWTAIAYHGNGVAMGLVRPGAGPHDRTENGARANFLPSSRAALQDFPLPAFRPLYLKGAYVWYGWQDLR